MSAPKLIWSLLAFIVLTVATAPAEAQGRAKYKHYVVSSDRAIQVSRSVLLRRGYTVVRVVRFGPTHVVYYRAAGRGRGRAPLQRMVIRTVRNRIVFEETEPSVLLDIDIKLNR